MANVEALEVPVEMRLELGTIIRLDDVHTEWESPHHLVDEANGGRLIAGIVDLRTRIRVQSSIAVN